MHFIKCLLISALAIWLAACVGPNPATPTLSPPTDQPSPQPADTPPSSLIPQPSSLKEYPCPDSDFTCVTLTVPLDHFDPDNPETIDVVFAMLPASGERKGLFVVATGGPGASGLAAADSYTAGFDPSLPEHFDIVFFDQRGLAASGGLQCASAAATFYRADTRADAPEGEAALVAAAQTFADNCAREMGSPTTLPYLGTQQAVEDLEAFRKEMGDQRLWLYGESYGTQFAQTYTAAHPDRVAGLILDGTVDLTLSGPEFLTQQAQAFNDVLVMVLEACNADEDCAADVDGDALAVYDGLVARLAESPLPFTFPLPSGGSEVRFFTLTDLETAASGYLFAEDDRMLLQRALAAAARDDLVLFARLLYDSLGLDPETLEAIPDPTYSDAVYYAVECNDYAYFAGASDERARAYLRAGDAVDAAVPRLSSIFYGDLPCAFWPTDAPDPQRPAPLVAEGIPTLVLGATADPATPLSNGEHVYTRLADGYLITTDGGPHVTFGWGQACPDDIVTAFLVDGELPAQREVQCEGVVAHAYAPLAPIDAAEFADPLDALLSVDDEIYYLPEFYTWDGATSTSIGCPFGGTFAFENQADSTAFTFTGCAFSAGFEMTGAGEYDPDADRLTIEVQVTGLAEGQLTYVRESDGAVSVTGEYDGRPVEMSEGVKR
ncbi:MAG TPA: alpha/beta hydrolase [Anaerolineae bacterium]|nr:alpha/beta hydrolase [Anaerolineae bacterium]